MRTKNGFISLLLVFFLTVGLSFAEDDAREAYQRRMGNGTNLYRNSRMLEAAAEFRRAQEIAVTIEDWARAIYWVILSNLGAADFGSAISDIEELRRFAPATSYAKDIVYHHARIYFNLGYFEDAMILFQRYIDSTLHDNSREALDRRAASFFWIGECLFFMGQFDEAERFYLWVVNAYPESRRVEASSFRIELIKQKKIEEELLSLLRWSHEEALRNSEEFQHRLRVYEHTLNAYQMRIAELMEAAQISEDSGIEQTQILPVINNQQTETNSQLDYAPQSYVIPETQVQTQAQERTQVQNSETLRTAETDADLLERARRLGIDINRLLNEHAQADIGGSR